MKIQSCIKGLLLAIFVILFYACSKEPQVVQPTPQEPAEPATLTSAIVGKWVIGPGTNASPKKQDQETILSIEFFKDSTYLISMSGGDIYTGKYGVTDTTEINIAELGTLSDIRIEGDELNFNLSTVGGSIIITANKAAQIPSSEETTKICRAWKLVSEDWSPLTYGFSGENKHAHIRFSASGTYLFTMRTFQDSVAAIHTTDWKWHPDLPNAIQYTAYNYLLDSTMTSSAEIIKLTADSLQIKDWYYSTTSNDGIHRDTLLLNKTHTFIPVE